MTGRSFRLPVQTPGPEPQLQFAPFQLIDRRFSPSDDAFMYYLRAPQTSGDYTLSAECNGQSDALVVQVRTLEELRQCKRYNGAEWPRRWPLGCDWSSTKNAQTLQDTPVRQANMETLRWWLEQDDETLWHQLPEAEGPRAHYVNVH